MATVKKGVIVPSPQWAVHLRDWKKFFWRKHRKAEQKLTKKEADDRGS